ncbi:MAG: hypothetical protein JWM47_618 [Acidimicrobiales bacterium]|nr:hypothetical protein [Acidimicrobiales bacterium]
MLSLFVTTHVAVLSLGQALARRVGSLSERRADGESGQATAEYALVLLGAAAVALLFAAWAAKSGKIGQLFDVVVDRLVKDAR